MLGIADLFDLRGVSAGPGQLPLSLEGRGPPLHRVLSLWLKSYPEKGTPYKTIVSWLDMYAAHRSLHVGPLPSMPRNCVLNKHPARFGAAVCHVSLGLGRRI